VTGTDPLVALEVLERVRSEYYPQVDAKLLRLVFELEHEDQFEDDRGPVCAALRDLITASAEAEAE